MAKTVEPKSGASNSVVRLKVMLRDTKGSLWRRLSTPGRMTLGDLQRAIQVAIGWQDSHLHVFDIDWRQYGDRHIIDDIAGGRRLTVNGLAISGIAYVSYTYAFGDNWVHMVGIERAQPALEGNPLQPALLMCTIVP
jgi:Plasmid pRiA4b ORF-3-like protein